MLIILCSLIHFSFMTATPPVLFVSLRKYCESLPGEFSQIPESRKESLHEIGDFIARKIKAGETAHLTYICTHNSRRSQFGQAWAKAAAAWYGLADAQVQTWSGGTEATAFNIRAVAALQRAGFAVSDNKDAQNPRYSVTLSDSYQPLTMFSKVYSDPAVNPARGYCALMVCTSADEACPIVLGAEERVSLPYEDPKNSDGKPGEIKAYDQTCRLIARETFYIFDYVAKQSKN